MRSSVYETDQYNHVDGLLVTVGPNVSFLVVLFFCHSGLHVALVKSQRKHSVWHTLELEN